MTDKELIRAYRECSQHPRCEGCPMDTTEREKDCPVSWFDPDDMVNRLEALLAENEQLSIELQAMRNAANGFKKMVPRWVSVSERLPKNNNNQVLVVVNGIYGGIYFHDAVEIAEFVLDEGWILEGWPDWENPSVTYWQPLPAPPNTEGVE